MDGVNIARMTERDIDGIPATFRVMNKARPQYERYFEEQRRGEREVLVASDGKRAVCYGTLVWRPPYAPFRRAGVPEIVDLNVLPDHRGRGIGSALILAAERIAAERGKGVIGIGAELSSPDYAPARRLYPKLGYAPDGTGTNERDEPHLLRTLSKEA